MFIQKTKAGSRTINCSINELVKTKDRVIINVGGTRNECYLSTIQNFPDTRLYWIAEAALKTADFDPDSNEFFFDRHPGCFQNILNYCRTGKLHCPNDVCGPLFEEELAFWGIDELQMEPCCWGNYTQHRNAHHNLRMFDELVKQGDEEEVEETTVHSSTSLGKFNACFKQMRPKIWALLEKPYSSTYAQLVAIASLCIIVISIASFCVETMYFAKQHHLVFGRMEVFYCVFFSFELSLRLLSCPCYKTFLKSFMAWVDFISTSQFYINFFSQSSDFDFLLVLRLFRIFRLFRFFKNLSGMQIIGQTLKASAKELFLLVLIVLIPMVIFSTLVYYAEQRVHDTSFSSIPESFWWAIVTMTTVGYGDMTPVSVYGKIVGAMCACCGLLIVALPVSVIGSNFTLYYSYAQARLRLPKRKRPALVLADRTLITSKAAINGKKPGEENLSLGSEASNSVADLKGGLKGLADAMVEITMPVRERRYAIQPQSSPRPTVSRKSLATIGTSPLPNPNCKHVFTPHGLNLHENDKSRHELEAGHAPSNISLQDMQGEEGDSQAPLIVPEKVQHLGKARQHSVATAATNLKEARVLNIAKRAISFTNVSLFTPKAKRQKAHKRKDSEEEKVEVSAGLAKYHSVDSCTPDNSLPCRGRSATTTSDFCDRNMDPELANSKKRATQFLPKMSNWRERTKCKNKADKTVETLCSLHELDTIWSRRGRRACDLAYARQRDESDNDDDITLNYINANDGLAQFTNADETFAPETPTLARNCSSV